MKLSNHIYSKYGIVWYNRLINKSKQFRNGAAIRKTGRKLDVMRKYVIFAYILFWIMVLGICGTVSTEFHTSGITMRWLADLCAWAPTFALLIMFKELKPGMKLKGWVLCSYFNFICYNGSRIFDSIFKEENAISRKRC